MKLQHIDWALVRHVIALVLVFAVTFALSATVTIFNKWFFTDCNDVQPGCDHAGDPKCLCRGWGFRFPIAVTCMNMLTSFIYATVCIKALPARLYGGPSALVVDRETYLRQTVPYAVLFSFVIALDNWAFRYIQVTFYEILKSFHPAILLVTTLVAGLEQFSLLLVAIVAIISTGLAVASIGEVAFSAIGMAMIGGAITLSSVSQVLEQMMLHGRDKPRVHPMVLLHKTMPISFTVLVPVVAVTAYVGGMGEWVRGQTAAHLWQTLALYFIGSVIVFCLNIANFLCILYTSALTVSVAGTIKTIIVFCTSWLFFRNRVTWLEVGGYGICLVGIGLYNYLKYRQYKASHISGPTVALPTGASVDGAYVRLQQDFSDEEDIGEGEGSDSEELWVQSEAIVLDHQTADEMISDSTFLDGKRQTSGLHIGREMERQSSMPAIPHVPDGLLDPDNLMHRLEGIPLVDKAPAEAFGPKHLFTDVMSWLPWAAKAVKSKAVCRGDVLVELTGKCTQPVVKHLGDPDAEFNQAVKDITIYVIVFILLYTCAYLLLWSLLKKKKDDDFISESPADRISYVKAQVWACTFSLAVAFGGIAQVPLTVISNEVKVLSVSLHGEDWTRWLDFNLIVGYWDACFMLSNISMFMLLPWAYFYREAETFLPVKLVRPRARARNEQGVASMQRSLLVLLLFWCIIVGIVYLVLSLLGTLPANRYDVWGYMPYFNALNNFFGALILLRCVPGGALRLAGWSLQLRMDAVFKSTILEKLYAQRLERDTARRKLALSASKSGETIEEQLRQSLEMADQRVAELERQSKLSPIFWNTMSFLLVAANGLMYIVLLSRLVVHCLGLSFGLVGWKETRTDSFDHTTFGETSVSIFSHYGAVMEVLVHNYYVAAGVVGFYALDSVMPYAPKWRSWNRTEVVVHCAFALVFSSALPVLTYSVGITDIPPLGVAGTLLWTSNAAVVLLYNISFVFYSLISAWNSPAPEVLRGYYSWLKEKFADLRTLDQQTADTLTRKVRAGIERAGTSPSKGGLLRTDSRDLGDHRRPERAESDYWDSNAASDSLLRHGDRPSPSMATLLHARKSFARAIGKNRSDGPPNPVATMSPNGQSPGGPSQQSYSTPIMRLLPQRLQWSSPSPLSEQSPSNTKNKTAIATPLGGRAQDPLTEIPATPRPGVSPFIRSTKSGGKSAVLATVHLSDTAPATPMGRLQPKSQDNIY